MTIKRISALVALLFLLSISGAHAADSEPSYIELKDSPTIAVDWSKGNTQAVTLGGNRKLTFSNGQKGGRYLIIIKQDATGSRTITLPASVRWPGVTPPINPPLLTTTANKTDYITFFCTGLTYDVLALAQNY